MDIERIDFNSLACAVLSRAVKDAEPTIQHGGRPPRRGPHARTALAFLGQPSDDLRFWCEAAGIAEKSVLDKYAAVWQEEKTQ